MRRGLASYWSVISDLLVVRGVPLREGETEGGSQTAGKGN